MELFQPRKRAKFYVPLAERMRPRNFDEFIGQEEIIGKDKPLRKLIEQKRPFPSLVFWGKPGCGKTALAKLIAEDTGFAFVSFSAVTSGVKEIKETIQTARYKKQTTGLPTILFVDEFHRFNRLQQDAFLPCIEDGTIILIGVTTENPSFEINSALLSRCRVFLFRELTFDEIKTIIQRAINDKECGLGQAPPEISDEAIDFIANVANGDARIALNILEMVYYSTQPDKNGKRVIDLEMIRKAAQRRTIIYDKDREEHYNTISAFIKSMRGSDPDAAVYWLARMLEAGEDPLFIARRLVIFASEDVGNADPMALSVAVAAKDAVDFVGMPEAVLALSQATIYLASAPKSNACYSAYLKAVEDVQKTINEPVPFHLRNPVTDLMKKTGYGKDYKYPHAFDEAITNQKYLPENLQGKKYYYPKEIGFEKEIKRRLDYIRKKKENMKGGIIFWLLVFFFVLIISVGFAAFLLTRKPSQQQPAQKKTPKVGIKPIAKPSSKKIIPKKPLSEIVRESDMIDLESKLRAKLMDNPELVSEVMAMFKKEKNEKLLFTLAKILQEFATEGEINNLVNLIYYADNIHKVFSIIALFDNTDSTVIDAIFWALLSVESEDVKLTALHALNRVFDRLPDYRKQDAIMRSKEIILSTGYKDDICIAAIDIFNHNNDDLEVLQTLDVFLNSQRPTKLKLFALAVLGNGRMQSDEIKKWLLYLCRMPDIEEEIQKYIETKLKEEEVSPEQLLPEFTGEK